MFFFLKGVPINFTMENIFILSKISLGVGGFVGGGMWMARLLKLKGF
ncbi:TraG family protein [Edwardsiella piscicida]|nr:TraG family protein [Edwardsiella piscicida]